MSRHGTILDVTRDPELVAELKAMHEAWPEYVEYEEWPRARWLTKVEAILAVYFPFASSRDRNVTARRLAPFPLAEPDRYVSRWEA